MMRRLLPVILLAASGTAASAGTYLGLGIGSDAKLSDGMQTFFSADGRSARLIVGQRFGRLSVEGTATRYGLVSGIQQAASYDDTTLGVALKYSLPLGNNIEAFGRGGFQRTWLSTSSNLPSWDGSGHLLGGGFEYRLNIGPLAGGSVFVDYERDSTGLESSMMRKVDSTVSMWTLGVTLSL
jgi:hypothetical protein